MPDLPTLPPHPLAVCDHCGDDVVIHDWITVTSCDRDPRSNPQHAD